VLTINGKVRLRRVRWYSPEDGSETPIDRWLDEAEVTISEGVREMACRVSQGTTSFVAGADLLFRTAHVKVSKETLRQLVEHEGKEIVQAMQQAELNPTWSAEDCVTPQETTRIYAGCDGVRVPLVTEEEKQKRRQKVRRRRRESGRRRRPLPRAKVGADNAYKEFKVGFLYDETKRHRYVGVTAGNHEAAGRMLDRMSVQVGMRGADERIALIDGAPWIRNQMEFHGLVDAIGLDFYHMQENVQKARHQIFGEANRSEGETWVSQLMHRAKHDGYHAVWDDLMEFRKTQRGGKREAVDHLMSFMAERREIIRYPEFQERHWQIGSGPTEAECKTTTQRVKGRGRRWDSDNAEAMMALSALHDSGLWHQRWQTLGPQKA
jgi:hypothetical protein